MKRVVIVGGGVTGLCLAHALERRGLRDLLLLEAQPRLGGNIATVSRDGFLLDLGPDNWVRAKPQVQQLAVELGMQEQLIEPEPGATQVHLVHRGRLRPLPRGMVLGVPTDWPAFLRSPLFSARAKLRVMLEPLVPRVVLPSGDHDPSVGAFAAARLGRELTDTLIAPLLGGIFAGSAWEISLRTTFPQLLAAEAEHGSLLRAFRQRRQPGGVKSPFLSLRGGMGSLLDRLAGALQHTEIARSSPVASVTPSASRHEVRTEAGRVEQAQTVVFAGPAHVAARALPIEALRPSLSAFSFGSSAVVFFAFRAGDLDLPAGSGFLVPLAERQRLGLSIAAGTFVSSKWAGRAPAGHVLLRVFFTGAMAEGDDDDELVRRAEGDLRRLLSVRGAPLFSQVHRLRQGSPRPGPGHLDRVRALRGQLERWPGLHLVGNGYDGSGIPDCVRQAHDLADVIAAQHQPTA